MVVTYFPIGNGWLRSEGSLMATVKFAPFSLPATVCACHGLTFWKNQTSGLLVVLRWDD